MKSKKIRNQLVSLSFFVGITLSPGVANADLDAAFSRLTGASGGGFTTSSEQQFRTSTRVGFAGGGGSVRFAHKRYSLVQTSPPRFSAGCNGIDFHFGGISFINAEQITQMLNQILNGTLAVAFDMAITALCSPCGAAMKWAEKVANWANGMAVDTCQASQAIAKNLANPKMIGTNMACSSVGMQAGKYNDWLDAKQQACDSPDSADSLREDIDSQGTDGDKESAADSYGNKTWIALRALGMAPKPGSSNDELKPYAELIMSWIGTEITGHASDPEKNRTYLPKIRNADIVMSIFICGSEEITPGSNSVLVAAKEYCSARMGGAVDSITLYSCEDDDCWDIKEVTYDKDNHFGQGFLYTIINELTGAIENVASNNPLTDTQKSLIAQAPFPLYRAINVAAISPEMAESIIIPHAQALSYIIALEYLKDIFKTGFQSSTTTELRPEVIRHVFDSMDKLRIASVRTVEQLSLFAGTAQQIMTSVEQVNKAALASSVALGIADSSFATAVGAN